MLPACMLQTVFGFLPELASFSLNLADFLRADRKIRRFLGIAKPPDRVASLTSNYASLNVIRSVGWYSKWQAAPKDSLQNVE